jgi:hypothetical protein
MTTRQLSAIKKGLRAKLSNGQPQTHLTAHDDGTWGMVTTPGEDETTDLEAENRIEKAIVDLNNALDGTEEDNGLECPRVTGKQ